MVIGLKFWLLLGAKDKQIKSIKCLKLKPMVDFHGL